MDADREQGQDEQSSRDSQREREVFKFLEPWRSSARSSTIFTSTSLSTPKADTKDSKSTAMGSDDTALAAFAQLGSLRLGAQRCMISLFGRDHEYILAESTRTLSLQSDSVHSKDDALWIGMASLEKKEGISDLVLQTWRAARGSRDVPKQSDHFHIDGVYGHAFVVSDMRLHDGIHRRIFPRYNNQFRFMCSVPIKTHRGIVIGAYTILDADPRYGVKEADLVFLQDMAETVMAHLDAKRAASQKQRAERLIKGLGLLTQGGSSLREWWLARHDKAKQSGRRQEREASMEDDTTDAQRADQEFGNDSQFLNHADTVERAQSRSAISTSQREDPNQGRRPPQEKDFAVRDSIMAESNGTPTASPVTSSASAGSKTQNTLAVRRGAEPAKAEHFNLEQSTQWLFSRASNLLRESLNVDGVLMLDAAFADHGRDGRHAAVRKQGKTELAHQESESDHTSAEERDHDTHAGSTQDQGRHSGSACAPFAYSTKVGSTLRAFAVPEKYTTLSTSRMEKLLKRYPTGKIFNFDDGGALYSSSGSGTEDLESTDLTGGFPERIRRTTRNSRREKEVEALLKIAVGARTIAFVPLWDAYRESWRAGALVWSTAPGRYFTTEDDLMYLAAFSNSLMAELTTLDTMATDQSKSRFISSVSHELRSPLHGVLAGVDFLLESSLDPFQQEMATTVKLAGNTILDTIDHILDFTKINNLINQKREGSGKGNTSRSTESVTTDLALLTENIVETVVVSKQFESLANSSRLEALDQRSTTSRYVDGSHRQQHGDVHVILNVAKRENWSINTTAGSWTRILTNLLGNALKYTSVGYIHINLSSSNQTVSLAIQDTGRGISRDFMSRNLYSPFMQEDSHANGTGLGLYIVKQLVNELNGKIRFESVPDRGTKVLITFPAAFVQSANDEADVRSDWEVSYGSAGNHSVKLGFYTDMAGHESSKGYKSIREAMLRSSLQHTCSDWLRTRLQVTSKLEDLRSLDVCFIIEHDFSQTNVRQAIESISTRYGGPFIVVLRGPQSNSRGRDDAEHRPSARVLFVNEPFGPRKLSRIVTAALDQSKQKDSPASSPSTSPKTAADTSPMTTDRTQATAVVNPQIEYDTESNGKRYRRTTGYDSEAAQIGRLSGDRKILLVEDNAINMKLLVAWARKLRQPYEQARNGLEAVEIYASSPHAFKLVLMDISMPVLDGLGATRQIRDHEKRQKLERCRIVALSGVASAEAKSNAQTAGIDTFISKPASLSLLRGLIEGENEE